MNNGDNPASPVKGFKQDLTNKIEGQLHHGLTKREHFAGLAMAALLTAVREDGEWAGIDAGAARQAVLEADALLKELDL